jgi:signal transduction histidine kinase
VEDLLLASRIAADQPIDLRLEPVDLVTEVQVAAGQRRLEREPIGVEAPDDPVVVRADRQRIGQVLANLLTNAVKYSPAGSAITVRVVRGDGEARIEVIDAGVGIPPEALPHLFDRFYRVEATATSAPGVGLGLYITRRIVEAHGGTIEVASTPGSGSTFTVRLPLAT